MGHLGSSWLVPYRTVSASAPPPQTGFWDPFSKSYRRSTQLVGFNVASLKRPYLVQNVAVQWKPIALDTFFTFYVCFSELLSILAGFWQHTHSKPASNRQKADHFLVHWGTAPARVPTNRLSRIYIFCCRFTLSKSLKVPKRAFN